MNRRTAFKNLAIIAGGIMIMPSCSGDPEKASIELSKLDINAGQERLLGEVAETIIPATDTPGGKELKLHLFALKMLNDCYEEADQQKFIAGLRVLEEESKKLSGNSFASATPEKRVEILESIEKNKAIDSATAYFYEVMKGRTIQGYMNSKYVMTNLIIHEIIPTTPYNGYAPA